MNSENNNVHYQKSTEDKTVAIISYLTFIGWIIALIMHNRDKRTSLGSFHLKQAFGVLSAGFAISITGYVFFIIPILGYMFNIVLYLVIIAAWLISFMGALNGDMRPLPFVGQYFQKWFSFISRY